MLRTTLKDCKARGILHNRIIASGKAKCLRDTNFRGVRNQKEKKTRQRLNAGGVMI
jgi:hypothetical protein